MQNMTRSEVIRALAGSEGITVVLSFPLCLSSPWSRSVLLPMPYPFNARETELFETPVSFSISRTVNP